MIRVLIAAGSAIVRRGLEALVNSSPAMALVGSSDPEAGGLAEQIEELQPNVVLLALRLEDDSPPVLPVALAGSDAPKLVVLADQQSTPRAPWTIDAIRSGARAILPRDATPEEIVAAIEAAAAGLIVFHPDEMDGLLPAARARPAATPDSSPRQALSPREIEVLRMLAEGLGNKEIAWRLNISEHTVKFHVNSIFTKLDASTRTEAVTIGIRQGLIMV